MATKIFTGDMPELMENILNNLNEEINSIYSCALVSRHWCNMSIPILWRDPFTLARDSIFISRYFSSLSEDDRIILDEYGIDIEFPCTLFNYSRFLKVFDSSSLDVRIQESIPKLINNLPTDIDLKDLKEHVANLLFKIFIESSATLSKLALDMSDEIVDIKPEIFYSLGQNMLFFSRLQDLSVIVESESCIKNAIALFKILADNATKINSLTFHTYIYEPLLCRTFASVIKSQEQLGRFNLIGGTSFEPRSCCIMSALECQKKALREIKIECCAYGEEFEVLMNCENLEVIRIFHYKEEVKLLKILSTNLSKISTLEILSYSIDASNLIPILENSGPLLQRLRLYSEKREIRSLPLLIETLISFCPNITYLYISSIKFSSKFLDLIGSLQKLLYLTLQWIDDGTEEKMKSWITQLAEILPSSLQYFNLGDFWINSHIDIFLDHCNAPLKRLLFGVDYDYDKTIEALIKFCKRKKTLNYAYIHCNTNIDVLKWDKVKKDLEEYVKLVPYPIGHVYVDC
ncbi:hypothetical protein C2G38_504630 [Gigaspora rosea]|uniref:Uncharacterized protein n=1 Tax=Gigaspora rosea TaxID=44941 RepID=A0A397UBV2_9GLOM|nr:hypothetical protein C2G38_504630 [Gigaspora rosea]